MQKLSSLEALHRDYSPKGVQFHLIYKSLAHPELNGYVQPLTLAERLQHAREAEQRLGCTIPWLVDAMDNRLKHALGDQPNSEFVIDPTGKIVIKRAWSNPAQLRQDLTRLVGQVAHPTSPDRVGIRRLEPSATKVARQVAPRVNRPQGEPLRLTARADAEQTPFYVKLRAEADRELRTSGTGTLYLGFHLDPIHHVHWNNQSGPIGVKLLLPGGVRATPNEPRGPEIKASADADPREFLIKIENWQAGHKLTVQLHYVGCADDDSWCKSITQEFEVTRAVDPDGGWVMRRSMLLGEAGDRFRRARPKKDRPNQ